jgi:Ca-activated chloride channel family protein
MTDELDRLKDIELPQPSHEGRRRALDAALLAFDAAQARNSRQAAQGTSWAERLRSIVQPLRGTWTMNTRVSYGLGTAAIVLLMLPLGYQLITSTALTPNGVPPVSHPQPTPADQTEVPTVEARRETVPPAQPTTMNAPANATPAQEMQAPADEEGELSSPQIAALDDARGRADTDALAKHEPDTLSAQVAASTPTPVPEPQFRAQPQSSAPRKVGTVSAPAAASAATMAASGGTVATESAMPAEMAANVAAPPPMAAGMAAPASGVFAPAPPVPSATQPSGDQFSHFTESPVKVVAEQPVSTFSIDVDTASYSYVRNALTNGWVPEPDSVRLEELINYFSYNYPAPDSAETPFKPTVALMPTPWNPKTELMQIGIKGYVPPATAHKPANLVFLIDTSGSMDEPDKLPLLKRAFSLLVDQLRREDKVSIVVYAGSAGVVLEPTAARDKSKILSALENLSAGGSTAGAEGIELAYRLAEQNKVSDGTNRVILATDGDFNVGIEDPEDLKTFIKEKRDTGVFLSVLGFGQGNLGDDTMQALAQNGNGNAAYIDSFKEAQKVLVAQAGGTLETIAKDVKIQVEFNPAFVSEYRLIGYETRALNREDFNNDKVDAGDVGAGTTVTAIYEITPKGSSGALVDPLRYGNGAAVDTSTPVATSPNDELAYLKLRYKAPEGDTSKLMDLPITRSLAVPDVAAASTDQRWAAAVAAFGQKLKGSNYGDMTWSDIRALAQSARGADESGYRAEFMQLIDGAAVLMPDPLCTAPPENRNCR